ncbi:MAG: hypothetical protein JXB10_15360 [Pirellulales bacterium]|nr:hypothetical protein [Pirellulales bacterium]
MNKSSMDFQQRLKKAVERGQRAGDARAQAERRKALNEKELQLLHTQHRLTLSERIERSLGQVADQFPGFQLETIVGEKGWGAVISRDDLRVRRAAGRTTSFSRLEMIVRPFSSTHILDLTGKGTVANREVFNRSQYQRLEEIDETFFNETIDNWALEFAELYAAKNA